jgi:trehalose 6-phosphate phosphatase
MTLITSVLATVRKALSDAKVVVWALDVDGTLVPFASHPNEVRIPDSLQQDLATIHAFENMAVLIISGRSRADLLRLFGRNFPGILIGNHGLDTGQESSSAAAAQRPPEAWREALASLLKRWPHAWLEDKGPTWAIHWRQVLPSEESHLVQELQKFASNAHHPLYACRFGDAVLDIFPKDGNKGTALISWITAHYGTSWESRVYPIAIGDDQTDDDMFRAIAGQGLSVLVGHRPTNLAQIRFSSPNEVLMLLSRVAQMSL